MAVTPSGKDKVTRWARLYVGGYDLSGDLRTFGTLDNSYEAADLTGVSEAARNFAAADSRQVGVQGVQVLMNDTASTGAFTLLQDADAASLLTIAMGGGGEPAAGDPSYHIPTRQMMDMVTMDGSSGILQADFRQDQLQYDISFDSAFGAVLQGPSSISASITAGSSFSIDFGAQQSGVTGWSAVLHVLSTSSGDYAITVQDSADDSAYSTIGTFAADASAITSELQTGTDTVERYVSINAVRTAGTITMMLTFVRN